jgi:hypothetical protein
MIRKRIFASLLILLAFQLSVFPQEDETPKLEEPRLLKSNFVYAGYSTLLPGLGQIKKDRLFTGIFFFSAFAASAYNYNLNLIRFRETEREYLQTSRWNLLLSNSSYATVGFSGFFSVSFFSSYQTNQAYIQYKEAESKTNEAAIYMAIIYFFQIGHAFFCSPGSSFEKPSESKNLEQSSFNFNFYPTRNQFGQTGTNFDLNYIWRF